MKQYREPASNIIHMYDGYASKPDPQYLEIPLADFIGSWVKKKFVSEVGYEHMCVKIDNFDAEVFELYGVLDNAPVQPMTLQCGDRVTVHITEIESWLSANTFER